MSVEAIPACPECDSPSIYARRRSGPSSCPADAPRWRCKDCGATFEEPRERARKRPRRSRSRSGLAGELEALGEESEGDVSISWGGRSD